MTSQLYTMRSASQMLLDPDVDQPADQPSTCRRIVSRVIATKQILIESYRVQGVPVALIREAIADAEAQAWQVGFPHLFLPDLADEILRQLVKTRDSSHPPYAQAA